MTHLVHVRVTAPAGGYRAEGWGENERVPWDPTRVDWSVETGMAWNKWVPRPVYILRCVWSWVWWEFNHDKLQSFEKCRCTTDCPRLAYEYEEPIGDPWWAEWSAGRRFLIRKLSNTGRMYGSLMAQNRA